MPDHTLSGAGVPASTPAYLGQQYWDTTNSKWYQSKGTASAADWVELTSGAHTHAATAISDSTAAGRALLTAADAAAQRTALGLGTAANYNVPSGGGAVNSGDLTGTSKYYSRSALTFGANTTLAMWVKLDSLASNQAFVAQYNTADSSTGYGMILYWDTGLQKVRLARSSSGTAAGVTGHNFNTALSAGQWTHLVVSNSGGTTTFYRNGVADGTASISSFYSSPTNFCVGAHNNGGAMLLDGSIAFVGVWDVALNSGQVSELYNGVSSPKSYSGMSAGLKTSVNAFWELGNWTGHTGTEVDDTSGNARHLTNNGSIAFTVTGLAISVNASATEVVLGNDSRLGTGPTLIGTTTLGADAGTVSCSFTATAGKYIKVAIEDLKLASASTPQVTFKNGGSGGTIQQVIESGTTANFLRIGTGATHAADCFAQHSFVFQNSAIAARSIIAPDSTFATTASAGVPTAMRHHPDGTSATGAAAILGALTVDYVELGTSTGNIRSGTVLKIWQSDYPF